MVSREQLIYEEATALWWALFDHPPPRRADGLRLLEIITHSLEDPSYQRLRSPFLRPSTIAGPGQPPDERSLRG